MEKITKAKVLSCLVIVAILMSVMAWMVVAQDVSRREEDLRVNYVLPSDMAVSSSDVPIYEFLTYANFGSDNSVYMPGQGVGGYENKLYVATSYQYCYVYEVSIPEGKDPNMHPDNPEAPGPMAPRTLTFIEMHDIRADIYDETGINNIYQSASEFYVDDTSIYYGPGPGGIHKWDHNWNYQGRVVDVSLSSETLAYDADNDVWYAGLYSRKVYSFRPGIDTSWQYEFTYPTYEGSHHDGLEFVNGFLWISDMTTNWIGQWKKNPDGSWEEKARFYYDNPIEDDVEGMGFGPLGHLWGTGWNRLYEIGGEELGVVLEGIKLSMRLDKNEYNPNEMMEILLKITDKDGYCTFPIAMDKIEIKIDENYVNVEDERIDNAIEWAEKKLGPQEEYEELCWKFVAHAYKKTGADWMLPPQGSAKEAANSLKPLKTGVPPRGAYAFYDSTPYPEYGHVGLSLSDTDGDGKTEIIHAYTKEEGVIISDDYNNIGGCTYIGWAWPPIKINQVNEEYLIKLKAPSDSGNHNVWVQVETDLGTASDSNSFSVFEPFTFVHMTDAHVNRITTIWVEVPYFPYTIPITLTVDEILSANINEINDINPDFVIDTGDIADFADEGHYRRYLEVLDPLNNSSIAVYTVPGNHDRRNWLQLNDPVLIEFYNAIINRPENCTVLISPNNYTFEHNGYLFIGLDSGEDYNVWSSLPFDGSPEGSGLGNDQMNELIGLNKNVPKIIFMHNPAINSEDDEEGWGPEDPVPPNGPGGNDACIANNRWELINYTKDNNASLVLTGHTHEGNVFNSDGNPIYGNVWRKYLWPLFIQTPSITLDAERHGYREFFVKADRIEQTYHHHGNYNYMKAIIGSPVTLHAFDSQERHTGINLTSGESERDIPLSFYFSEYSFEIINEANETVNETMPEKILLYDVSEDYLFKVVANLTEEQKQSPEIEHFNFTVERQTTNGSRTIIFFSNISLFENTTAILLFNMTTTNYAMEIDYNGDGMINEARSPDFVYVDYMPKAEIISPINNSTYLYGEEITFNGTGTDPEDGVLTNESLVWFSDLDGMIGIGNEFRNANLSVGSHNITLRVNDTLDQMNTSTVSISIRSIQPDMFIDILKDDEIPGIEPHTELIETLADKPCNLTVYIKNTGYGTLNNTQILTNVTITKDVGNIDEGEEKFVSIQFTPTTAGLFALNVTVTSDEIDKNVTRGLLVEKFDLKVSIPKTEYNQSEPVPINISVTNEVPNIRFIDLKIEINISGSYNQTFEIPLLSLAPLATKDTTFTWDTTGIDSGTYTIVTSLIMADRGVAGDEKCITINPVNKPPVADANGPYIGYEGSPITFNGTGSYDPDGTIVSYEWDFDDDGEFDDATGPTPTETWKTPYSGNISLKVTDNNGATDVDSTNLIVLIPATVDFDPDVLNKKSKGKMVTVYIEFPTGYDVADINVGTIILNETVSAKQKPTEIGDYDYDGIPDLMVKFDWKAVTNILPFGDTVNITITGELTDGSLFEGSDVIRVIDDG